MVRTPIVAVLGATGCQGGSVVKYLLQSETYRLHIRAITRDAEKTEAQALKGKGVDVVQADLCDYKSMVKAFENVQTAFLMTNYFDPSSKTHNEYEQALTAAQAAKEAGVENVIFSTLEDLEKASNYKYKVPHFTLKAKAAEKISKMGFASAVFVEPGFYLQNLHKFVPPRRQPDGSLAFMFPSSKDMLLPTIDIRDFGGVVRGIIEDIGRFNGQTIPVASEWIRVEKLATDLGQALGMPVSFIQISDEHARQNGMFEEFIQMFHAFEDVGFFAKDNKLVNFDTARALNRDLKTWPQYLASINLVETFESALQAPADMLSC